MVYTMSDIFRSYHSILENANVLRRKEATTLCIGHAAASRRNHNSVAENGSRRSRFFSDEKIVIIDATGKQKSRQPRLTYGISYHKQLKLALERSGKDP